MQAIKYFTLLTLMVGLCGSCARTPLADEAKGEPDQVSFSTKVASEQLGNQEEPWNTWNFSKGTPLNPATDQMASMGIFCYVTTPQWATAAATAKPDKMNNVPLHSRKDGTTLLWEYEPDKTVTWEDVPYPANVTFFGYSPVATADNGLSMVSDFSAEGTFGAPVLRYAVPTEAAKQPDLMVAIPRKDMMRTKNDVQLVYHKALTTISFSIKGSKNQKVTDIYLKGVSLQGDLSLDIDPVLPVVWSNLQAVSNTPIYVGKTADVVQAQVNTGTPVQSADGYLMMIPQELTADAVVVVELEGEPARSYSLLALQEKWTPGHSLTYTLMLDETTFVVTPANWLDVVAAGGSIDVTVSGANWAADIEGSGLSISPTTGGGASTTVQVSWTANSGLIEPGVRYGTVTFKANSSGYGQYEFQTSQLGEEARDWIEYNGVKWAKGNLIANGTNSCKIGAPTDGGLHFQFGGLIGFKGGSDGTGVGRVSPTVFLKFWGGALSYSADNDIAVWPTELTDAGGDGKPATWPMFNSTERDQIVRSPFFDCSGFPYNNVYSATNPKMVSFRTLPGIIEGQFAKKGVGDPCTYYLGEDWQTPSIREWHTLLNNAGGNPWSDFTAIGAEIAPNLVDKENIYFAHRQITIPVSGLRSNAGKLQGHQPTNRGVQYWATDVDNTTNGWALFYMHWNGPGDEIDLYQMQRHTGLPVRCIYNK